MSDQLFGVSETEIPMTAASGGSGMYASTSGMAAPGNTLNSTANHNNNNNNNNNFLSNSTSSNHRPNYILGGVDRQVDETSAKLRENFLAFLERYRESSNSSSSTSDPTASSSTLGTSEMLLSTTQGSEPALFSESNPLYRQQLSEIRNEGFNTIYVDFNHLYRFDDVLANAIAENFYR
jgi:hypothetical protein